MPSEQLGPCQTAIRLVHLLRHLFLGIHSTTHTYTMNAVALNVSLAPRVRVAPKAAAKPARAVSPPSPRGAPATIFPTRAAIISRK